MGRTTCRCLLEVMLTAYDVKVPGEKLDALASVIDDLVRGTGVMGVGGVADAANALINRPDSVDDLTEKLAALRDTLKAEGKL